MRHGRAGDEDRVHFRHRRHGPEPRDGGERVAADPEGVTVRYTVDRNAFDRVEPTDDNGNVTTSAAISPTAIPSRSRSLIWGGMASVWGRSQSRSACRDSASAGSPDRPS